MTVSDNIRYRDLKVSPGVFIPDVGIEYPTDDCMTRLVDVTPKKQVTFDENYPYLNDSLSFKIQHAFAYFLVFGPFWLMNLCKWGLKVNGRKVLREHRKEFKKGVVSIANHCYKLDGMAVAEALGHQLWIPMLHDHFTGSDAWYLTHFGGIPLSDGSLSATRKFNEAFDTLHARGGWIHVFPEARNWHFYKPLRPFRKGAFTMAYRWGAPILPINISFRPRTGIYLLFGKKELPLITVNIGEPIFPDTAAPRKTEVDRLLHCTHQAICRLGGITANTWPPFIENAY